MKQDALRLLRVALNDPAAEFRSGQWEAIEALVERRERLLVVQRTGWGKSVVYFLATRLLRDRGAGCTLLVSPLLALMRNQIQAARRIGVRAETINSANPEDWARVRGELQAGRVDILLISPERLANDDFMQNYLLPISVVMGDPACLCVARRQGAEQTGELPIPDPACLPAGRCSDSRGRGTGPSPLASQATEGSHDFA